MVTAQPALRGEVHLVLIYIKRLGLIENEPTILQESYVPYHICPLLLEEDAEHQSLQDIFEKQFGLKITKIKNHLESTLLNQNESRLLNVTEGSAAILLTAAFLLR